METVKYLRLQWDRVGAVLALVAAVVLLVVGYVGTARTEYIAEQIPYLISCGLVAVLLLTVAAVLWISADLRDEWRVMHRQNAAILQEQLDRRGALVDQARAELSGQAPGRWERT